MSTRLNPYLSFRSSARPAMEFYRSVFGGELTISTFADFQVTDDPAERDLIMHAMLVTPGGLVLMAADTPSSMELVEGTAHSVSLSGEDLAELTGYWERLSDGAQVEAPFLPAPWGDTFGMCTDRYGVRWMVNAAAS